MANLDQAVLAIKEIAQSGDTERAFRETEMLFFKLVQGNSIFIMPTRTLSPEIFIKHSFRPYTAPLDGESEDLYIRIFSDRKLVAHFAAEHDVDPTCIAEINGIELVQLAKYWFVRGSYGFLLNDCAEWITITLPDFLKVIYSELIDQPQKYNQEFVDLIRFVYQCKSVYSKIFLLTVNDGSNKQTIEMDGVETFCFVDEQLATSYSGSNYILVEVTESCLKKLVMSEGVINITTIDGSINSTMEHLRYAYASAYYPEEVNS